MDVLAIERLTVRADRVVALVRAAPSARMSTPVLAARLRQEFPLVAHHACVNDEGCSFGDVMECTPLPHVLEHLVIDLQTRAHAQEREGERACGVPPDAAPDAARPAPPAAPRCAPAAPPPPDDFAFVGTTEWLDEARGLARVEVNFTDDLVALRAFRDAARFLNAAVVS